MQFALIESYFEAWRCYSLAPASVDLLRCVALLLEPTADPSRLLGLEEPMSKIQSHL